MEKKMYMPVDIVIPLGNGSKWHNNEIKYFLRSVESNLANVGNIWIIGILPKFLKNVNHISMDDPYPVPDANIMRKITKACETKDITDTFILANDDHYLVDFFDANNFPYFYEGTMAEYIKKRGQDGYSRRVQNSLNHLEKNNLPTKFFDIHTPIAYQKEAFLKNVTEVYDLKEKHGFTLKSLYANALKIEGEEMKDGKMDKTPKQKARIVSSMPRVKYSIQQYLHFKFPEKSKYENTYGNI